MLRCWRSSTRRGGRSSRSARRGGGAGPSACRRTCATSPAARPISAARSPSGARWSTRWVFRRSRPAASLRGVRRTPKAQALFSQLVDEAARGRRFVIAKAGTPVARIVPLDAAAEKFVFGTLKDLVRRQDEQDR